MLFRDWLTILGHSGLCTAFFLHLDPERVAGRCPYWSVNHPQDDESMDSSVLLSAEHLCNLQIPTDKANFAPGFGQATLYLLSQGSSILSSLYMQILGAEQ